VAFAGFLYSAGYCLVEGLIFVEVAAVVPGVFVVEGFVEAFVVAAAPSASLRRPEADLIFAVAGFVAGFPLFVTGSAAAHGRGHVFFCLRFPGFSK
jgi:hypothetical protein